MVNASSNQVIRQDEQKLDPATNDAGQNEAGKKIYCNYWLRKGECDYTQQGCMYKHEMPLDKATLASLGLREVPRWYRDLWASKATATRTQKFENLERPWRGVHSTELSPPHGERKVSFTTPLALASMAAQQTPQQSPLRPRFVPRTPRSVKTQAKRAAGLQNVQTSPLNNSRVTNGLEPRAPSAQAGSAPPIKSRWAEPITLQSSSGLQGVARSTTKLVGKKEVGRRTAQEDLLGNISAAAPVRMPAQDTLPFRSRKGVQNAIFYPNAPRISPPAHPRLFLQDGQEKFAVNQLKELTEE